MSNSVRIYGQGLANFTCAKLLAQKGYQSEIVINVPAGGMRQNLHRPKLLLNDVCVSLLNDFFPAVDWQNIGHRLNYREVLWGGTSKATTVKQPSIVISSERLHELVYEQCQSVSAIRFVSSTDHCLQHSKPDWHINSPDYQYQILKAGNRVMWLADAELRTDVSTDRCYIETVSDGWLFLIPYNSTYAHLQAMVADPDCALDQILDQSWLVASLIRGTTARSQHPAAPRIHLPLICGNELLLGHRAVSLDPISGEGTPFALRSAILASAIIDHASNDKLDVSLHSNYRLIETTLAHINWCVGYYSDSFSRHPSWQREIARMIKVGRKLTLEQSKLIPKRRYKLVYSGQQSIQLVDQSSPAE